MPASHEPTIPRSLSRRSAAEAGEVGSAHAEPGEGSPPGFMGPAHGVFAKAALQELARHLDDGDLDAIRTTLASIESQPGHLVHDPAFRTLQAQIADFNHADAAALARQLASG